MPIGEYVGNNVQRVKVFGPGSPIGNATGDSNQKTAITSQMALTRMTFNGRIG